MDLSQVEGIAVTGTWWRQIPGGGDVYHRPVTPPDGRWQRGSVVEALYFADTPETAWAEWYRALAELEIAPTAQMPRDLWRWEITLSRVANLSDDDRLAAVGLQTPRPGRHNWPAFQAKGEALHAAGWPALLAPSAARPRGAVLCLFRAGKLVLGTRPVGPPQAFDEPPPPPSGMTT